MKWRLSLILLILLSASYIVAQGCSDAGFCTINSFKPNTGDGSNIGTNQIKIGAFLGTADNDITVFGNYLEYNRQFSEKLGVDVKLTYMAQRGNDISRHALGDIFVNVNYQLSDRVNLTSGIKAPLMKGNASLNNLPLPMDYQASLGTWDFILGVGFNLDRIQLVAALQQPLTQNDNEFFASRYPASSNLRLFQSTNEYVRSGDFLIRASYPVLLSNRIKLTPSLLPIYHLGNDKYTDEQNVQREIAGSSGLTLNGNVYLDFDLHDTGTLQFNIGMPFIIREARPDGLTRGVIASLEYRFRF